ncbi:MAG: PAS domain-containing protein [bacterium]
MVENITAETWKYIMNSLPFEITYIDQDDRIIYFNKEGRRIFSRPQAIIGRKVQQCHPQKTIHLVNQVINDLRSGRRDCASFWIDLHRRKLYIRYFAIRDEENNYIGCMELTQDVTEIQQLEGERRLL